MAQPDVILEHPNRETPEAKSTRATVVLLLIVSAVLMTVILLGGWEWMSGFNAVTIGFILLDLLFAYYVARWVRGVLPVAAALAMIVLVFAGIAVPSWFDRDATGFGEPTLPPDVLGILCAALIPVQLLLMAFAMRGFNQAWNVQVERPVEPHDHAAPHAI
jgi:hypothetical protein